MISISIIFPISAFLQLKTFYLRKHIFIFHLAGAGDTCPPRPWPDIKQCPFRITHQFPFAFNIKLKLLLAPSRRLLLFLLRHFPLPVCVSHDATGAGGALAGGRPRHLGPRPAATRGAGARHRAARQSVRGGEDIFSVSALIEGVPP